MIKSYILTEGDENIGEETSSASQSNKKKQEGYKVPKQNNKKRNNNNKNNNNKKKKNDNKRKRASGQLPTSSINSYISNEEKEYLSSGKKILEGQFKNSNFGFNVSSSSSSQKKQKRDTKGQAYSLNNVIKNKDIDLRDFFDHLDNILGETKSNSLYRYAVSVSVAQGNKRPDYYITTIAKQFINMINKHRDVEYVSTKNFEHLSGILRSISYSIQSNFKNDARGGGDARLSNNRNMNGNKKIKGANAKYDMKGITENEIYLEKIRLRQYKLLENATKKLNKMISESRRISNLIKTANWISQRKFYINDALISLTDHAMAQLSSIAPVEWIDHFHSIGGKPAVINATRLIFASDSLRENLAQLTANIKHKFDLSSNNRPTMQITYSLVGDSIQRYSIEIINEIERLGIIEKTLQENITYRQVPENRVIGSQKNKKNNANNFLLRLSSSSTSDEDETLLLQ
jgi:hypothetical protein